MKSIPLANGTRSIRGGGRMKKKPRKFTTRIIIWLLFLTTSTFFVGSLSMAAISIPEPQKVNLSDRTKHQIGDSQRILAVLERKMGGKKIPDKAREKLFALNENQTRLLISLCERISIDEHSAGAEIACFVILALVLLS
jgi:hypothetical protein